MQLAVVPEYSILVALKEGMLSPDIPNICSWSLSLGLGLLMELKEEMVIPDTPNIWSWSLSTQSWSHSKRGWWVLKIRM